MEMQQSYDVMRERSRPIDEQQQVQEEEAPLAATRDGPWAKFVMNSHLYGTLALAISIPICAVMSYMNGHAGKHATDAVPACRGHLVWDVACSGYKSPEVFLFVPASTVAFCLYALSLWQASMFLAEDPHQPEVLAAGELYRFVRSTAVAYDGRCADGRVVEVLECGSRCTARWLDGYEHMVRIEDLRTIPIGKLPARLFLAAGLVGCFLGIAAAWISFNFDDGSWHLELAQYSMIAFLMSMALRSSLGVQPYPLLARVTTVVTAVSGLLWSVDISLEHISGWEVTEWIAVFSLLLHTFSWPVRAAARPRTPEALLAEA